MADIFKQAIIRLEEVNNANVVELPQNPIKITINGQPLKSDISVISNVTTPIDIMKAEKLKPENKVDGDKSFKRAFIAVAVDGELRDLNRPLESDCDVKFMTYDDAPEVYHHSSAHLLGYAFENLYKAQLGVGPALDEANGFYYDAQLENNKTLAADDVTALQAEVRSIIKSKVDGRQPAFSRHVVSKEQALYVFEGFKFKTQLIQEKIPDGEQCTLYRVGNFVDFCRGPHVPSVSVFDPNGFLVTKASACYWKGDAKLDSMQRAYGISFPTKPEAAHYLELQEIAAKYDHRVVGNQQKLFFFSKLSPGCCFWLPHGARIYHSLQKMVREKYFELDYHEVISPEIMDVDLWKISGHWTHYRENMFSMYADQTHTTDIEMEQWLHEENEKKVKEMLGDIDLQRYGCCPMNCPKHCLMFKNSRHSFKELPIRYTDFGALHRNEASGALTGLTRVRRFCQDDGHIFLSQDMVADELLRCIKFVEDIYSIFGFTFELGLSTKPAKAFGTDEEWKRAEASLAEGLNKAGYTYTINEGDGAFYGPKIDIELLDVFGRRHQCATIQLDFQLPQRFGLKFINANNEEETPVIIHRAVLGSVERFFAILTENVRGKWPFWLSPRQVAICSVPFSKNNEQSVAINEQVNNYAKTILAKLKKAQVFAEIDISDEPMKNKIARYSSDAEPFNFIVGVGFSEVESGNEINIRQRGSKNAFTMKIDDFIACISEMKETRVDYLISEKKPELLKK